jgi:dihydrofolate synthase/folylpolyglutamate synthase
MRNGFVLTGISSVDTSRPSCNDEHKTLQEETSITMSGQHLPEFERSEGMEFLYGRLNYERQGVPGGSQGLGLHRMRRLMRRLGDPHLGLRIVHVAGSKGKGSTSTMISAGLTAAGFRTGLFCSPHLHTILERYRIDDRMIEPDEFASLLDEIRVVVERMDRDRPDALPLTFFEITTAMGLLHFARNQCEAVVLEVGMGGRLDSTNIVRPLLSVITSISLEHTRQLGPTTELIAAEKAGIIKREGNVVSGVRDEPARLRIREIARSRRADLKEVDRDYRFTERLPARPFSAPKGGIVKTTTWSRHWNPLPVPLLGPHQAENAALAQATFDRLSELGLEVRPEDVQRGWSGLTMPARVEVQSCGTTTVVIDGAHSPASAKVLAETLARHFPEPEGRQVLVFGTTREKDLIGQLRYLATEFDDIIVTRYQTNPRARSIEETVVALQGLGQQARSTFEDPADALTAAIDLAGPDGRVVVTGSLFLAAEIRDILSRPDFCPELLKLPKRSIP